MGNTVPEKYSAYVVTDLPKYTEVTGHHAPVPFWIAPNMFPGINIEIAAGEASKMVGNPNAAPHTHDIPEVYLCVTENRGDVVVEIQIGDEKFTVESPFAVFVPPGTDHCFAVLKCDSPNYVFGIGQKDWKKP
ncbi:cupin domain-containing protein [Chloroflexota bacterium]